MRNEEMQTLLLELVDTAFVEDVNKIYPTECYLFDESDYAGEYKKYLTACFYQQYECPDNRTDQELAEEVRNIPYQQDEKKDGDDEVKKMLWTLCGRHGLETEYMLFDSLNDIALDIEEKTGLYLDADVPM